MLKEFLSTLCLLTLTIPSVEGISSKSKYEIEIIKEDIINNDIQQTEKPVFYINDNIGGSISALNNDPIVELKTLGKYNFKIDNNIYEGNIIGSNLTSVDEINHEIKSIMHSIENNCYFDFNEELNYSNVCYTGLWETVSDKKNIYLCDDKEHFGKVLEWENIRKVYSKDLSSYLYSITTQLYILPNQDNHSFRTDGALIDIDVLNDKYVDVRDYEPKTNPVSRNVSYGFSLESTISNEGIEGTSGINVNYNIIEKSPIIKSLGSMADNNTSIYFDYINAHHNKGDFFTYSTTETYQCTTTLIKAQLDASQLNYRVGRTFEFFKDGFWSNYFRQFKFSEERKINI